jgi:hypothetical protein
MVGVLQGSFQDKKEGTSHRNNLSPRESKTPQVTNEGTRFQEALGCKY